MQWRVFKEELEAYAMSNPRDDYLNMESEINSLKEQIHQIEKITEDHINEITQLKFLANEMRHDILILHQQSAGDLIKEWY
jgi:peptidoglycan hydrolase CwlO-like protein